MRAEKRRNISGSNFMTESGLGQKLNMSWELQNSNLILSAEHQPKCVSTIVLTLVTILSSETATAGASVTSMRVGAFCSVFARISDSTFVYVYKRKD